MKRALKQLRRVLHVTLEVVATPLGVGTFLWLTTWTNEPAVAVIRVTALVVVVGLVASFRNGSREEGSLIRRYAIVVPQALIAAWVWTLAVGTAVIGTRATEIELAVLQNWPDFPLWSDPTWGGGTYMVVTEWMNEGVRLAFLFPILWWMRRYATARQSSAWIWSFIAWAGCLFPVSSIIAWNFPGDAATGGQFWSAGWVIGAGIVVGAVTMVFGTVISLALGRNPFDWVTGTLGFRTKGVSNG